MSKEQNMEDIAQAAQEIANFLDNAERSKDLLWLYQLE